RQLKMLPFSFFSYPVINYEVKPMMVKLKKQKEGWRIDSIECLGHDFGSLYKRIKEEHPRLFPK
ncbi:MAG: hypothetical protein KKD99_00875, partial [Proteobacteria bacterium]|nr:hypothetical protein [Pseudomonadota bacterium]